MMFTLDGGPMDGSDLEVADTAFEGSRPGRTGIKVSRGVPLPVLNGHGTEVVHPQVGYYERVENDPTILSWSGWL